MLSWIIPSATMYMGDSIFGALMAFLIIAFLFAIRFALFAFLYSWLISSIKKTSILYIFLIPTIWAGLEYLNAISTTTFPWVTFHLGYTLVFYPKFIQLAEFTGVFGISFLIILVNYIFYVAIKTKKVLFAIGGFSILALQLALGWLMMTHVSDRSLKVKVAIIQENIPAQLRWDENIDDSIVEYYYLSPLRKVVNYNPDLILWSETAIPWKFYQDDKLVYEALNISWQTQAGHIMGIHSEVPNEKGISYNSAYYIHPNGDITGRYDKIYPLKFLETPLVNTQTFGNWTLSFFNESLQKIKAGTRNNLLKTPYGKIGISICNESVLGFHASNSVKEGANYLMVMSNDAWFANTQFPLYHLSHSIMRAVENRRDVVVNSNGGYAGIIDASGKVIKKNISNQPEVLTGMVSKRTQKTFYTNYGDAFALACIIYMMIFLLITLFIKFKKGDIL